jgi:drug/metabolite transporter (DMT)-like permease
MLMKSLPQPQVCQIGGIVFAGGFAISSSAIFVRLTTATAQDNSLRFGLVMAAARLGIAAILLFPRWLGFQSPSLQSIGLSMLAGLFLAIHFATWISSLAYTSITASTTLVTTNPIWVALLSWVWLREPLSWKTGLGIAIALFGGLVIGGATPVGIANHPLLGNSLALAGAWAMSLYLLISRAAQQAGVSTADHVLMAYSTAAIALFPVPLLMGGTYTGYPPLTYLWFGLMALIPQVVGHTSFNWALKYLSPTRVTLAMLLEPIGAGILGYLVFHELPGLQTVVGAVILLVGVAIAIRKV